MSVRYREVVKLPEHLRRGKQHIVVYESEAMKKVFAEGCNNCFVVHSQMTKGDWVDMIEDFNSGSIKTLVVHKSRAASCWLVDKSIDEVDVVFTEAPTYRERLKAFGRLKHFRRTDLIL